MRSWCGPRCRTCEWRRDHDLDASALRDCRTGASGRPLARAREKKAQKIPHVFAVASSVAISGPLADTDVRLYLNFVLRPPIQPALGSRRWPSQKLTHRVRT